MCKMIFCQWFLLFFLLLEDVFALKNVVLTIKPPIVERCKNATLICSYDLEGANLYTVKWYRGNYEFYRFIPSERPMTKNWAFGAIILDEESSNSSQVVLKDIDFQLSGNFSCEVTTAEEPASTKTDVQSMLVVQLPKSPPTISVGREPLNYNDILRANCSSPPSRPPARLRFLLNDLLVASSPPLASRQSQEPVWSDLALELPLQEYHFNRGRLTLRCEAQVARIYFREAELELASALNPVPAKVSADDSATYTSCHRVLSVVLLFLITRV